MRVHAIGPRAACVVAGALLLASALSEVAFADLLPTPAAGTAATPTPCTPVAGELVCPLIAPTAAPAAPTATAKPPAATSRPAAAAPTSSHKASPSPTPSPTPGWPGSSAPVGIVAATFRNAPFLGSLLTILKDPIAGQHPDLRHFRVAGADAGSAGGGASGTGPAGHRRPPALPLLLAALAAVATAALLRRPAGGRLLLRAARMPLPRIRLPRPGIPHLRVRLQPPTRLATALMVLAIPAGAALVSSASGSGPHRTARGLPRTGAGAATTEAPGVPAAVPALPAGDWAHLLTIERGLIAQQDELAQQEALIRQLTDRLALHPPVEAGDSAPLAGHAGTVASIREQLASLVSAHTATAAAYAASVAAEYDLYRTAAQDPPRSRQLVAAASAMPDTGVRDAVAYNLNLLQTQISQEAAIQDAESKLGAVGALSTVQLSAISRHRPFIVPVVAPVSQPFGPTDFALEPPLSYGGQFYPHFHTGLDLAAPDGTPVHAAADGVVILAAASVDDQGRLAGYGNYVVIRHASGFETLYGHLQSVTVHAGQVVHQGDIVGLEGSTGWSTGPHVHFEIRNNGAFLDPAPYLSGQIPS